MTSKAPKCPDTGKRRFLTKESAEFFLQAMNKHRSKSKGFHTLTSAYQCKFCGWWHTTKQRAR